MRVDGEDLLQALLRLLGLAAVLEVAGEPSPHPHADSLHSTLTVRKRAQNITQRLFGEGQLHLLLRSSQEERRDCAVQLFNALAGYESAMDSTSTGHENITILRTEGTCDGLHEVLEESVIVGEVGRYDKPEHAEHVVQVVLHGRAGEHEAVVCAHGADGLVQ